MSLYLDKYNVIISGVRTSVTLNKHVVNLLDLIDGTPTVQELIDDYSEQDVDVLAYSCGSNKSAWVTSIIAIEVYQSQ